MTNVGDEASADRAVADLALRALSGVPLDDVRREAEMLEGGLEDRAARALLHQVVAAAAERARVETDLRRTTEELAEAQRIGRMGSYDWEIATDTNRWSDELYRIYGTEPQSFNASYERFLSFVHPEDRDHIRSVHQKAFETKEPYHTVERIVRADGEERLLDTWGELVTDDEGNPLRMRGICRDVTEQVAAERAAQESRDRLAAIVDSTPDALLVVDDAGVISDANHQVLTVLGYEREELIGRQLEVLLPERYRDVHVGHRAEFVGAPHSRSMGVGLELFARRKDGSEIPVDVALGTLTANGRNVVVAFVRDVSERRRSEELTVHLREAQEARKRALEINDNVVQGVVTALLRLELDELGGSEVADGLRKTLAAARGIISDLLGERDLEPGALVRSVPADS